MVFDDLNIGAAVRRPNKPDAPLPTDPYVMLPRLTKLQFFHMVDGWKAKIAQDNCNIQRRGHSRRAVPQVTRKALAEFARRGIGCKCTLGALGYYGLVPSSYTCKILCYTNSAL